MKEIVPAGPIYLYVGRTEIGPYVKRIVDEKLLEEGDWCEITLTGKISWWFTSECSKVVIEKNTF